MAKKKTNTTATEAAAIVISPVSVENITVHTQQEIIIPAGYVLLTALNEDGTEKENSAFFYPEKNYLKYYGDTTKFRLKTQNENIENTIHHEYLNRTSQQIISRTGTGCSSCGR